MAVELTTLAIKLDSSGVASGMEQVGAAAGKLSDRTARVQQELAQVERTMQGLPRAAAPTTTAFEALNRKIDDMATALREQAQAQREQVRQLEEAGKAAKEYQTKVEDAAAGTDKLSRGAAALGGLIGGLVAQGVLTLAREGIALLTAKMREAGRAADEERAKIKSFFDELDRQIEIERKLRQPFSTARGELQIVERAREALEKERAALEARIAATRALPATLRNQLTSQQIEAPERQLAKVNAELVKMDERAAQIRANLGDRLTAAIKDSSSAFAANVRQITAAEKVSTAAATKAAQQAEQRRKSLEAMGLTELQLAAANAGNLAEELRLRREIIDRGIEAQVRAMQGLLGPERELEIARRKALQDTLDATAAQDRLRAAEAARLKQLRAFSTEQKGLLDALRGNVATWQGQQLGKPQTVGDELPRGTFGLPEAQRAVSRKAQKTLEEQLAAERQRIEIMRQVTIGVVDLSEALLGLDRGTANGLRAVADLAAGIATKNPAMIISGGLNLIGSIFGDGGRAERQAAREARAAQLGDINQFIESIRPQGTALEELARSYQALHAEGKRLSLGNHELARLTQAYANEQARLMEIERLRNATMQEDLQVRLLVAEGRDAEATALRFAIEQQREYTEAITAGYTDLTLATLAQVQAIEAEAEARRVERLELERVRQQRDLSGDFASRTARLAGDTVGADRINITARWQQEKDRITDLFTDGIINEAEFIAWLALLEREWTHAIDAVTEAVREQAAAFALLVEHETQNWHVRELRAQGLTKEAALLEQQIRDEAELQRMREQGLPDTLIAYAEYVLGLERAKRETESMTKALEDLAAALKREMDLLEDVNVRRLRATGSGDAADEAALFIRHQREIDALIKDGISADTIAKVMGVQGLERQAARDAREQRQLDAFKSAADHNFSLTDPFAEASRTTQNLAVGVTGSQADRIAGMLTSQLVIQSQNLPSLPQIVQRLDRLVALVARSSGLTAEQVEAYLTETEAASERALGINPSNR